MRYRRFLMFNVIGASSWILSMTLAGYWLGRVQFIADHFELVVLTIVAISVLPVLIGAWRAWRGKKVLGAHEST
jgi:membrane-associated protein